MRSTSLSFFIILCLALAVAPVMASTLYSNGPINGTTDAWQINFDYSVSDSFSTYGSNIRISGLDIGVWLFPGDSVSSVQMDLGRSPFGGDVFTGVLNATSHIDLGYNQYGYDLQQINFSFSDIGVAEGSYWLTLSNAVSSSDLPIYWDENSGPSLAFENVLGSIPSEAFTVTGTVCMGCACGLPGPDCGPPIPEPGSILLLASGMLGLAGALHRKFRH
jgi:hypothetical protein